ncbi:hypothetical protein Tco_0062184 [Tanacetum coccineum]
MPTKGGSITMADMMNPLYLHPSDGPHTGTILEKLSLVKRDPEDEEKQDQWDTCNNMVNWFHDTKCEGICCNMEERHRDSLSFKAKAWLCNRLGEERS